MKSSKNQIEKNMKWLKNNFDNEYRNYEVKDQVNKSLVQFLKS